MSPESARSSPTVLRISPTTLRRPLPSTTSRIERQHDQRQLPVLGQQLAADDLVRHHAIDQLSVFGALRQLLREQRFGNSAVLRRLARREQRNDAAGAVDQLEVGDQIAQLRQRFAIEQRLAFDHDQHVELARRKAARHRFVLLEFGRVGAKQLAERIVDLDAPDPERRRDAQHDQDQRDDQRETQRDEADPLDPERDAMPGQVPGEGAIPALIITVRRHGCSHFHAPLGEPFWCGPSNAFVEFGDSNTGWMRRPPAGA